MDFNLLLKSIRKEARLTQEELASVLGVSKILIAKLETGKKDPTKRFLYKLAKGLLVSPKSLGTFLMSESENTDRLTGLEQKIISLGEKLQKMLIKKKAKHLKEIYDKIKTQHKVRI